MNNSTTNIARFVACHPTTGKLSYGWLTKTEVEVADIEMSLFAFVFDIEDRETDPYLATRVYFEGEIDFDSDFEYRLFNPKTITEVWLDEKGEVHDTYGPLSFDFE